MNEDLRSKIRDGSGSKGGIKETRHLRAQLKKLSRLAPPDDYDTYVRSKAWRSRREQFLADCNHQCVLCGGKENLHVHHLHYQSVGRETAKDVTVCCRRCHFIEHLPKNDNPNWAGTQSAPHTQTSKQRP
ncbi:MAG: hypothetical protein O3B73_10235 [bacterium]|nr:hypothetical protein [bacterium]